ncbi:hypothetical protein NC652_027534 [Populus alba x Populus x berolinensis]|nr:hypothetical protein NC652_027534 [Populus alba x Populus x berolinensis]
MDMKISPTQNPEALLVKIDTSGQVLKNPQMILLAESTPSNQMMQPSGANLSVELFLYESQAGTVNQQRKRDLVWKLMSKWNGPERIEVFLWTVAHNSLLTNETRGHRIMAEDPRCHHCPLEVRICHA